METHFPPLAPITAAILVTNMLPSGAAFGTRLDDGTDCYIPVNVSAAVKPEIGDEFSAKLVTNRYADKVERTPWLAVYLARSPSTTPLLRPIQYVMPFDQFDIRPAPVPLSPSTADRVRVTMQGGGVWTVGQLFAELFPGKTRGDGLSDYNAVSTTLRVMFGKGECSKFAMWKSSDQSRPSREWFTCYPERADVDEWED